MAVKKKTFKPDYFASKCGEHETFGVIYDSLLTDEQFSKLSISAKYIYCCCRNQLTNKRSKQMLFRHGEKFGRTYNDSTFVFPARDQALYGFKDRSNFAKNMNELIEAKLIVKLEDNKARMKPNVYQFSDGWKNKARDGNIPQK